MRWAKKAAGNVLQIEAWKKLADAEKRDRKLKRFTEYDSAAVREDCQIGSCRRRIQEKGGR